MAKGIEKVAERFCVETAVYWGNPVNDGYGTFIFDAPIEIPCRWENITEGMQHEKGKNYVSRASVLLTQDVSLQGFLFRGKLTDLPIGYPVNKPQAIEGAFIIMQFNRIPMVRKTDEFVRTAYLYEKG